MTRLRLALVAGIAPRKLGSLEAWLIAMAEEARRRHHRITIFTHAPVHQDVLAAIQGAGAEWMQLPGQNASWALSRRFARDFDVVHLNLLGVLDRIAVSSYLARKSRVVFVDHYSGSGPVRLLNRRRLAAPYLNRRLSRFVGVSDYVRTRAIRDFCIAPEVAQTIYNGVDVHRLAPAKRTPQSDGKLRLLAVANLIPEKGIGDLLSAFTRLDPSRFSLAIAGDGPEEPALRRQVATLGIGESVTFLGLRNDVPALLAGADVFVHPACWDEAFGLTVAEAMATGLPVVSTRKGAIPEIVRSGATGLLVEAGDPAALAGALEVLESDRELGPRLGDAGRKRVVEMFSMEGCVGAHLDACVAAVGD